MSVEQGMSQATARILFLKNHKVIMDLLEKEFSPKTDVFLVPDEEIETWVCKKQLQKSVVLPKTSVMKIRDFWPFLFFKLFPDWDVYSKVDILYETRALLKCSRERAQGFFDSLVWWSTWGMNSHAQEAIKTGLEDDVSLSIDVERIIEVGQFFAKKKGNC